MRQSAELGKGVYFIFCNRKPVIPTFVYLRYLFYNNLFDERGFTEIQLLQSAIRFDLAFNMILLDFPIVRPVAFRDASNIF